MNRKTNKRFAVVPFVAVPHREPFRFNGKWWKRKYGTTNYADCMSEKLHQEMKENAAVGILTAKLRDSDRHYIITLI